MAIVDLVQLQRLMSDDRWREVWEGLIAALPCCEWCKCRIATHVEQTYCQDPPCYRCSGCLADMPEDERADFKEVPWIAHLTAYRLINGKPARVAGR